MWEFIALAGFWRICQYSIWSLFRLSLVCLRYELLVHEVGRYAFRSIYSIELISSRLLIYSKIRMAILSKTPIWWIFFSWQPLIFHWANWNRNVRLTLSIRYWVQWLDFWKGHPSFVNSLEFVSLWNSSAILSALFSGTAKYRTIS